MVQHTPHEFTERFWGSYRPQTYFGLKTRDPDSLVMGLMWFSPLRLGSRGEGIRCVNLFKRLHCDCCSFTSLHIF